MSQSTAKEGTAQVRMGASAKAGARWQNLPAAAVIHSSRGLSQRSLGHAQVKMLAHGHKHAREFLISEALRTVLPQECPSGAPLPVPHSEDSLQVI